MDEEDRDLSALIRDNATRYRASPAFASSVRTEIALEAAALARQVRKPRFPWFQWGLAATAFVAGVLATGLAISVLYGRGEPGLLERELVSNHVRALMADHLIDVASADQHTVKPWFQGRLDYSPPVADFATDGFTLAGGRLDYLSGRPVAALVYRRHQHYINLFIWPAGSTDARRPETLQGFHVVSWIDGGMQYWAVSDVNLDDLAVFKGLWQQHQGPRSP